MSTAQLVLMIVSLILNLPGMVKNILDVIDRIRARRKADEETE